jgi:hypothetical protein
MSQQLLFLDVRSQERVSGLPQCTTPGAAAHSVTYDPGTLELGNTSAMC